MTDWDVPEDCIDCSMRRLRCDKLRPACTRCSIEGCVCSYDWTLGPHVFARFGAERDVGPYLEQIRPHEAKGGSYGRVYRVSLKNHPSQGEGEVFAAVKVLHNHKFSPGRALELGLREAGTWVRLNHPNIAPFSGLADYQHLVRGGMPELCMVSPWAQYGNAEDYIKTKTLTWLQTLTLLRDIACGLEYLHTAQSPPIIHGDLKANNVLMFRTSQVLGGRLRGCLIDFGISRSWIEGESAVDTTSTLTGGNPRWMAWERLCPQKYGFEHTAQAFTTQSDVFETMRTFFQILTKTPPYHGLSDLQVLSKIQNEENPLRPWEGVLHANNGIWALISWGWRQLERGRPSASDVKTILESNFVWDAMATSAWGILPEEARPLIQEIDVRGLGPSLVSLCARFGTDRTLFCRSEQKVDVVCSQVQTSTSWLRPESIRSLVDIVPVWTWQSFKHFASSLQVALSALEGCRSPAPVLKELWIMLDDLSAEGYPSWEWTKGLPPAPRRNGFVFGGRMAELRFLKLRLLPMSWWTGTYANLLAIDIRYHPACFRPTRDEWVKLFRGASNLRELTVIASGPEIPDQLMTTPGPLSEDTVSLPALESLILGCLSPSTLYYLLYTLCAPQLQKLTLQRMLQGDYRPALASLDHSGFPHLCKLTVYYTNWVNVTFLGVLLRLEHVQDIRLWYGDRHLEALTRHCRGVRVGERPLLPNLKVLYTCGFMCKEARRFLEQRIRLGYRPTWVWRDHGPGAGDSCRTLEDLCRSSGTHFGDWDFNSDIKDQTKDFNHSSYQASRLEKLDETVRGAIDEEMDQEMHEMDEEMDDEDEEFWTDEPGPVGFAEPPGNGKTTDTSG